MSCEMSENHNSTKIDLLAEQILVDIYVFFFFSILRSAPFPFDLKKSFTKKKIWME